jgi:F-type H+-transporting ATPase subunit epsilon
MKAKIHLEIVTPEGVKFSEEVDGFTAPSVEGQFGVLPSHRPLLAGLKTGIVSYEVDGQSRQVAVGPGFAKVADDQANIITDRFMAQGDVDPVIARKDLKEAQNGIERLASDASEEAKLALIAASRWAAVRLELYGDPPPATVMMDQEMRLLGPEKYEKENAADDSTESNNAN